MKTGSLVRIFSFIAAVVISTISMNAAAVVVIDFQTGAAGAGGTLTESGQLKERKR